MLRLLLAASLTLADFTVCAPVPTPPPPKPHYAAASDCRSPGRDPVIPKAAPPNSTYLTDAAPPVRYRTPVSGTQIDFLSASEADRICAGGIKVCGRVFYACAQGKHINMPNPCDYPMTDGYARLLCHELAHLNGWPASHGD